MKTKKLFLCLFAATLTAMMLVPQVVRAELLPQKDSVVVIKEVFHPGEIVNLKGWSDKILIGKPFEHTGTPAIGICPSVYGDPDNHEYQMGPIYCIMPGEAYITASEVDLAANVQYHFDIKITVDENNYVTAGFKGGKASMSAIKDTTFNQFTEVDNWVGLFLFTGNGGQATYDNCHTFAPEYVEMSRYSVHVTSSNPDVAEVSGQYNDKLLLKGFGTTTITVSCDEGTVPVSDPLGDYDVPVMAQSFSYNVSVKNKLFVHINVREEDKRIILDEYGWAFNNYGTTVQMSTHDDQHYMNPDLLGLTFKVISSNKNVIEISDGWDANSFSVTAKGYGKATITATFEGNDEYMAASDSYEIEVVPGKGPNGDAILIDDAGDEVLEISMQEGETLKNPILYRKDRLGEFFARSTVWGSKRSRIGWVMDGEVINKEITALAAGDVELQVAYSLYKYGPYDTIRVPVHISGLNGPVTVLDLSMDPGTNGDIVFNASYNSQAHQVEINGALSDSQVKQALATCALGTPGWVKALPNSMSFNLPAGKGSISITGAVIAGYELRALIRGQEPVRVISETQVGYTHTINYQSDAPVAIVFYVVPSSVPSAPQRRVKAEGDTPLAVITAMSIESDSGTGIGNVHGDNVQSTKVLINGVLYIERNGVLYDAQGRMAK